MVDIELKDNFPFNQVNQLAELAWKLGLKIDSVRLPKKYRDDRLVVNKVNTDYMTIKIKYG
ncbi:MAG: hypothetical protein WC549_00015 [Actinomycetota bacterium]